MNPEELIERNFERLKDEPYSPARVFREPTYDWPGDMEGRAMLAFVCHYLIHGKKVPQFDEVFRENDLHVNQDGYYGALFNPEAIDEQQLAGNSWYLRGLLAYGDAFRDSKVYAYAKSTIEKLYKPALKTFPQYPVQRDGVVLGGVYGNLSAQLGKWKLSSDIGCAFIALDGIGHYYQRFPDQELHDLLVPAIDFFLGLDREGLHAQSHGTLSALRGILCFYEQTKEECYLTAVEKVFRLYREKAMTLNYDCYNWFGRPETWSEPCAVTDSLILATKLYKITKKEEYRVLARRVFFNAFHFSLRPNGGAGPNSCTTLEAPCLHIVYDEAFQCCTMRYAEGLLNYHENQELFQEEANPLIHQEGTRYFRGDHLLCEDVENLYPQVPHYEIDGKSLIEIPTMTSLSWDEARRAKIKVSF